MSAKRWRRPEEAPGPLQELAILGAAPARDQRADAVPIDRPQPMNNAERYELTVFTFGCGYAWPSSSSSGPKN